MEFTSAEKRIIMAILIAVMEADGIIDPREEAYLSSVIESFGITEADLDQIDELDFNFVVDRFQKFDEKKKEEAIKMFLLMAESDEYSDPRELKIIQNLKN